MKWVYIAIGVLIIYYVGQVIEGYYEEYYRDIGHVQIIQGGVQP